MPVLVCNLDSREDIRLRQDAARQEFPNLSAVSPASAINDKHPHYSKDFFSFCQQMMDSILNNTRSKLWPDDLEDDFLEAVKHVWRMRKLALAFEPTASTITAKLTAPFDANIMDALEALDLFQGGSTCGQAVGLCS
uniref:Uncharacterized protein n=1 Tax=Physcomitrium patens TaxID=3218 RepID=A9RI29_PHYPA|nr:hypothetical protein PHYPA_027840 [Physcomitrium patens]